MKEWLPQDAAKYLTLGLQLAVNVLLGLFVGYWLDGKLGTLPWLTVAGSALGLTMALVNLIRQFYK